MTTPTTPEQARDFAQSIFDDGAPDDEVELIRSLAEQVEALTKERDNLSERYQTASRLAALSLEALSKALKERDALKYAAWLALDVVDNMAHFEHEDDPEKPISEAIAALKAVL